MRAGRLEDEDELVELGDGRAVASPPNAVLVIVKVEEEGKGVDDVSVAVELGDADELGGAEDELGGADDELDGGSVTVVSADGRVTDNPQGPLPY